jgi:MraZ protein
MFRGISAVNLDAKGRMAVPSRYRVQLEAETEGQLIVTIDTEHPCLLLYPMPEWELIERKVEALPSFNPTARRIQRLLIGHATEVELDNNGRILLPPLLREHATLDKRVMLVGQGKKIEIWNEEQWQDSRDRWLTQGPLLETDLPEELKSLSL